MEVVASRILSSSSPQASPKFYQDLGQLFSMDQPWVECYLCTQIHASEHDHWQNSCHTLSMEPTLHLIVVIQDLVLGA
jgi:hypothetical protein